MFYRATVAGSLALGLLAIHVVAVPMPALRSTSDISWGSCEIFGINSTDPNLQCGYLEVPMDYHDSSAGKARLAVARYAGSPSEKLGTLFFNPGGPGQQGVGFVATLGPTLGGFYDFVSWDPRGVGYTTPGPVYCFNTAEEDAEFWKNTVVSGINETISGKFNQRDFDELYSQVDFTEQKFKTFADNCRNGASGPYLKYLGTSSTVRDLVSLGDAIVGQDQPIDFWGASYGTVIGFNFLNMFPERTGHVILDGVADQTTWASYKLLQTALTDSEKTYSGLTDGCARAGRASCKLVEITGDNATGDDIKTLINNAHDITLEVHRQGYDVPVLPGLARSIVFSDLYNPGTWSQEANNAIYQFVAFALQAAQTLNIPIPGGRKYNVPTVNITISSEEPPTSPSSYSQMAIAGADDFVDGDVTIKDVFDVIVSNTRELTPAFGTVWTLGPNLYKWPVRSVERLPPYTPAKLKMPVLVIGNSADPITPFANAQKTANLLGNNAFLVEQLGFGHSSLAQVSTCTSRVFADYLINSTLPQGRSTQCAVDNSNLFPPFD